LYRSLTTRRRESQLITGKIGKRAQKGFVAQWKHVGALNGQIEEAFTGHALVKVFGRRRQVEERFRAKNDELFDAGYIRDDIYGLVIPLLMQGKVRIDLDGPAVILDCLLGIAERHVGNVQMVFSKPGFVERDAIVAGGSQ